MTRVAALAVALVVAALLGAADGAAVQSQNPKLFGTVGPEFEISFRDAQGNKVAKLDPGTYDVQVRDLSDFHTFHLQGLGVDERTDVSFTGSVNWTVTFKDGNYSYFCDPHPTLGDKFVVGSPAATTPPSTTPPPVTAKTRLLLTSGPRQVITLKTAAGKTVKTMKRGTYTVTVRDRGNDHNAHIVAPGYNRKTVPLSFKGTQTWKVALKRTGTFRFLCDPHAAFGMRGSAKIVR
ncbi:MAG: plastocyanin/azurin family copper-binding protein [Actinomycetota bacterium]|nr:plastocyanin/azurin family copper-binding protein [Actinomycetota bacterium]